MKRAASQRRPGHGAFVSRERLMSTSLRLPSGSAPIADAACLGTVLGIWAHPDDEAFLSAGLMAAARDAATGSSA